MINIVYLILIKNEIHFDVLGLTNDMHYLTLVTHKTLNTIKTMQVCMKWRLGTNGTGDKIDVVIKSMVIGIGILKRPTMLGD